MHKFWWRVETVLMAIAAFIAGAGIGASILLGIALLAGELR